VRDRGWKGRTMPFLPVLLALFSTTASSILVSDFSSKLLCYCLNTENLHSNRLITIFWSSRTCQVSSFVFAIEWTLRLLKHFALAISLGISLLDPFWMLQRQHIQWYKIIWSFEWTSQLKTRDEYVLTTETV
jgi:hypothetical protein